MICGNKKRVKTWWEMSILWHFSIRINDILTCGWLIFYNDLSSFFWSSSHELVGENTGGNEIWHYKQVWTCMVHSQRDSQSPFSWKQSWSYGKVKLMVFFPSLCFCFVDLWNQDVWWSDQNSKNETVGNVQVGMIKGVKPIIVSAFMRYCWWYLHSQNQLFILYLN